MIVGVALSGLFMIFGAALSGLFMILGIALFQNLCLIHKEQEQNRTIRPVVIHLCARPSHHPLFSQGTPGPAVTGRDLGIENPQGTAPQSITAARLYAVRDRDDLDLTWKQTDRRTS